MQAKTNKNIEIMKHYNQMPLNILQIMLEREIIEIEKTHDVHIEAMSFHESDMYQNGDDWCETIYATMNVGGELVDYEFEWDCDSEEITTVMKADDAEG